MFASNSLEGQYSLHALFNSEEDFKKGYFQEIKGSFFI